MTSNSIEKDSVRSISSSSSSSSSIIIDDKNSRNFSFLLSCCGCSRTRNHLISRTIKDTKTDVSKGFFQRIQFFKAQKRQSSVRKQQLASTSNGHLITEIDNHVEQFLPSDLIQTTDRFHRLNNYLDSYSFTDIEVASSIPDQNQFNLNATPKSLHSRHLSIATTNLSQYSTQSLLRKLLDKAQILDEYYKNISTKSKKPPPPLPPSSSLSSSSNSLLERSDPSSRYLYHHHHQSNENIKKLSRKKPRHYYENLSSDNSRFNLYNDEDNILRELLRFNNDIDLILSRLDMENENIQHNQTMIEENDIHINSQIQQNVEEIDQIISTMRLEDNEINIHSLLANDIHRLREIALLKLLNMGQETCHHNHIHNSEAITLNKLNKLPKSSLWKGKRVFGVPVRIYQQTTGHILPIGIINALQYLRLHAGKCDGLFRKPGVKSKIDRLRTQIELTDSSFEIIQFDEYQPFVVADVVRQYFRELPESLIPPSITRLLCDLFKCATEEEQLLAIRYTFLLLTDETREVLETLLRFLLDVSKRLGNNQTSCRSLARIFLPSVFQSYYNIPLTSSKILWWKWKKTKSDCNQQETERLVLEQCLMTMIVNIDLLCRIPSTLCDELQLPSARKTKRLDELVRNECNGEFHLKKYISKKTEQFLQRLSNTKFKNVPINFDDVTISIHKPSVESNENCLPLWKCSIDIPNTTVKQVQQRILHERYLWDNYFAEERIIEKFDQEKEIMQYVLDFHHFGSIRSFCEFRFSKKIASRSTPDIQSILISSISIDHLQNHFLPGGIGMTEEMHYYITPSTTHPNQTTVTQIACVDYGGRSRQWYENIYGSFVAQNLISLRNTFTNVKTVRI